MCIIDPDDGDDTSIVRVLAADPSASDEGMVVRPLQATHDLLNANANLQVGNTDVGSTNPVDVQIGDGTNQATVTAGGDLQVTLDSETITVTATDLDIRNLSSGQDSVDTELPAAAALSDAFANPTAPAVGAFLMGYDGATDWERVQVTGGAVHVHDGGGTISVDGTVTADAGSGPWPVTDNAGSLTVDAPTSTPVNVQVGDGTNQASVTAGGDLQITLAGESVTVTGTVTADQGTPQTAANGWPIRASDGSNLINVGDNANSAVRVNIVAGAAGGVTHTDDAVFTGASDDIVPMGALYDTTPPTITDGNAGIPRMNSSRQLYVDIAAASAGALAVSATDLDIRNLTPATDTVQIGDGTETALVTAAGSLAIDIAEASATVTVSATDLDIRNLSSGQDSVDTELPAAAALTDAFANPTAPAVGAFLMGWDGSTDWERLQNTSGALHIHDGGNTITVDGTVTANAGSGPWPVTDNAGSLTVDAPVGTPVNVQLSDGTDTAIINGSGHLAIDIATATATVPVSAASPLEVVGDVADDVAAAGNPVLQGGVARTTDRTAVAAGDAVYTSHDILGKVVTSPYTAPDQIVWGNLTKSTTGYATLVSAPGAGVRNYITSVSISNSSGTATLCTLRDSVTTANSMSFYCAASGGGASHVMPVPWRLTANAALEVDIGAALSSLYFTAQGFKAAA